VFSALLEVEEDEDWLKRTADDDDDDDEMHYVGMDAIANLAQHIGGKVFLPPCFSTVQQLLQSADWRQRHAGLMAVSQIGEACKKQLMTQMDGILQLALPFFQDPHPRVVYAAMQLVGVFCDDLAPEFQSKYNDRVVPAIMLGLQSPHLKLKGQAAAVLVNFCEGSEDGVLDQHLDTILGGLVPALQVDWKPLQEDAVTALAHVATHSKAEFSKYYPHFMPGLKVIVGASNTKETRQLRGKAIECMALIGAAVSEGGQRAVFEADAAELMNLVLTSLAGNMDADDPMQEYLLLSIPRVAQALKEAFVPYLPKVAPIFLGSLKGANPQDLFSIQDEDETDDQGDQKGMASQVLGIRGVGKKRVNVHVEALTEKMRSAEILCNICANLEEHYFPYLDETLQAMLPLMDFPLEEIRHSVIKILPELMRCGVIHHEKHGGAQARAGFAQQTLRGMLPVVLAALVKENDTENASMLLENFAETIQLADVGVLTAKECDAMLQILKSVLNDCKERQQEMLKDAAEGDADEKDQEDVEEDLEVEFELQAQVGECLGAVIRSCKNEAVVPFDAHFKDTLGAMMAPNGRSEDKMMAMCAFIDIIEHGVPAPQVLAYASQAVPAMAAYTQDKDADLRQAAAYGLGVIAQSAPEQFAPSAAEAVKCLSALVLCPGARGEELADTTENAINAMGKVGFYAAASVDATVLTQGWLQQLPLVADRVEAKNSIILMDKMILASFQPLFTDPPANVKKVLEVLVDGTTIKEEGTQWASMMSAKQAVTATLQHLQAAVPAEVLQGAYATLSQEHQALLQQATA